MAVSTGVRSNVLLTCLSTDIKPTGPALNNAYITETDTGKTYQYLGGAWISVSDTTTLGDALGNKASINPFGGLAVSVDPSIFLADNFDGASVDTNQWTTGGTVPPTVSGGNLLVQPGTAASASSSISSIPTLPVNEYQIGWTITLESTPALGNHRFWGLGTQPGSWTAATPLQDAVGFEITTAGVLRAIAYSAGSLVFNQVLSIPTDGLPHQYNMFFVPGFATVGIDNQYQTLATIASPTSVQNLPLRRHSINGLSTTTGTPTWSENGFASLDYGRLASSQCDGVYPWRKQTVLPQGTYFASVSSTEGQRATYRYAISGFTPVATPTAFAVIQGSATKVGRVKRISVGGVATAAGNMPIVITRRSTAGTLGSAVLTAITPSKHDTNDGAATVVVSTVGTANYTTLGTTAGVVCASRIGLAAAGSGVSASSAVYEFSTRNDKPLLLRGASDYLTIEGNGGAVPAGGVLDIEIEIEEDTY